MVTVKDKIDFNEKLTNVLRTDPEFVAADERLSQLKEELKKSEMAFSFGEFDRVSEIDADAVGYAAIVF
jgi:hypothetical protein